MKRMDFPNRKKQRRKEAEQRQAEYDKLSLEEKFKRAAVFGNTKQSQRLEQQLDSKA